VTLTEAIVGLAESGEAVAILPRAAADAPIRAGRVTALRIGQGLRRRWQLITLATGVSALHVQCFASAVQQVAADAVAPKGPTLTPSTPPRAVTRSA